MKTRPIQTIAYLFLTVGLLLGQAALEAQDHDFGLRVGEKTPEWLADEEPNYETVRQAFIKKYGEDRSGWPAFIVEAERLNERFIEYIAKQDRPEPTRHFRKFFNTELNLGDDPTSSSSFYRVHNNHKRNYYSLFHHFYSTDNLNYTWYRVIYVGPNPVQQTYFDGEKKDGLLAAILHMYASSCPPDMLDWLFDEVFKTLDFIYQQDDPKIIERVLNDVRAHAVKLTLNKEFLKAEHWLEAMSKFISTNRFRHLEGFDFDWTRVRSELRTLRIETIDETASLFREVYHQKLNMRLHGLSSNVTDLPEWPMRSRSAGVLRFNIRETANTFEQKRIDFIPGEEFSQELAEKYHDLHRQQGLTVNFPVYIGLQRNRLHRYTAGNSIQLNERIKRLLENPNINSSIYNTRNGAVFIHSPHSLSADTHLNDEHLIFLRENHFSSLFVGIGLPTLKMWYINIVTEWGEGGIVFNFDRNFRATVHDYAISSLYETVDELFSLQTVHPEIYGLDFERIVNYRAALKADATPREVRPDGESTIDISATLYEYIPGDDASSTPLAGETVTFEISEIEGIRPGRLSSATAATGADGISQVTYTAPTADELKTIEEFRRHNITVKIRSEKHNVDDLAYITIRPQRGKAFIEPSIVGLLGTAYGGSRGIVPPDGRFPALIRAFLEDENIQPLVNTEATVTILSEEPVGLLRSPDGEEAVRLNLVTDGRGNIAAHYFYALETPPEVPVKETIQITSDLMTTPLEVEVSVGLNMVIDNVESAYEGRGVVSAGEHIPLRIRVKDVWNPDIDLSEIIKYWGLGEGTGDTRLSIRLEIENISSIPGYVMDHFRQTFYPEPPFDERVEIISSERLAQKNLLWVPDYSLLPYRGYPRVRPVATGNHYYEARISLVDHHGEVVFETDYPATKGFFNLHTDMPADEIYLYFVNNPLRPQTEGAEYLAIALDWLGAGSLVSVVDALDAINRGDTDALFSIMFSEIRGYFMDQAKEMSPDFKEVMTQYSRLSFADRITDQIQQSVTLRSGDTKERLFNLLEKEFADAGGTLVMYTDRNEPGFPDVSVYENKLHYDVETGIASLQSGGRFFFILPEDLTTDEHRTSARASSIETTENARAAAVASPANEALHYNEYINLSSNVFGSDESISVAWHNLPGSRTDWISVVPADASDRNFGSLWWYTSGEDSGIRDIGTLRAGVYEVRVYYDWPRGSYRVESRLRFSVK